MKAFIEGLRRRHSSHRRVRHLLLADSWTHKDPTSYSEGNRAECHAAYKAILMMIAPTLETLTVTLYGSELTLKAFVPPGVTLPVLVDLTVNGSIGDHWFGEIHDSTETPRLPALRRVHLYGTYHGSELLETLASAAPGLTYLRMSGLSSEYDLATRLGVLLRREGDKCTRAFSTTLRYVTLQAKQYPQHGRCGTGRHRHWQVIRQLEKLEEGNFRDSQNTKVVVLPEQPRSPGYVDEGAKADWLDVVAGGDGCWRIPQNATIGSESNCAGSSG